jgi:hypothetical protein
MAEQWTTNWIVLADQMSVNRLSEVDNLPEQFYIAVESKVPALAPILFQKLRSAELNQEEASLHDLIAEYIAYIQLTTTIPSSRYINATFQNEGPETDQNQQQELRNQRRRSRQNNRQKNEPKREFPNCGLYTKSPTTNNANRRSFVQLLIQIFGQNERNERQNGIGILITSSTIYQILITAAFDIGLRPDFPTINSEMIVLKNGLHLGGVAANQIHAVNQATANQRNDSLR